MFACAWPLSEFLQRGPTYLMPFLCSRCAARGSAAPATSQAEIGEVRAVFSGDDWVSRAPLHWPSARDPTPTVRDQQSPVPAVIGPSGPLCSSDVHQSFAEFVRRK